MDCVIDGVTYTVEFEYEPAEPHRGESLDIRDISCGGYSLGLHLTKACHDSIEFRVWQYIEQQRKK